MTSPIFHSLTFKIGAVIVLVEIVVLAVIGFFYIDRFQAQIDEQVNDRIGLPGRLMNDGLLNIDAVKDKETMERLVGKDLVELADGMVVGVNGNVFHALDPKKTGSDLADLPGISAAWFGPDSAASFVEMLSEGGNLYLVSVTPLFVADGQTPFLFAFIKVNVKKAEAAKGAITRYFAVGSLFAVALTSLVIILLFRTAIVMRLEGLLQIFRRVETGDLAARLEGPLARDEIGNAQRGVNAMAARLQGTIVDLTDYVDALEASQEEREALIEELENRNAELERFAYTVSHDLKAPLVTIKGFLGLLRKDTGKGDVERVEHDIGQIAAAADTMNRLLGELLELSRIGRKMNPPESVELSALASEAADLVAEQIAARGVAVEIEPQMPAVFGDRMRLLEVYQNLIDNGVKFMGHQIAPRVEVGARHNEDRVLCYVRDNGIGIDAQYLENVFGLFNRLDQDVEGTGIGLALVRRIVEVHGGSIWVESEGAGQGSTFWWTLPRQAGDRE